MTEPYNVEHIIENYKKYAATQPYSRERNIALIPLTSGAIKDGEILINEIQRLRKIRNEVFEILELVTDALQPFADKADHAMIGITPTFDLDIWRKAKTVSEYRLVRAIVKDARGKKSNGLVPPHA